MTIVHQNELPLPLVRDNKREQGIGAGTLLFVLSMYYLQNTIAIPGLGIFPGPLSAAICVIFFGFLYRNVSPKTLGALILVPVVGIALSLFSLSSFAYLGRAFLSAIQLLYMFLIGYALFLFLSKSSLIDFNKACKFALWTLIAISVLELFTPVSALSDAFRFAFYGGRSYAGDARDILDHGGVRPKAFASEPSYLALYISLFFTGALWTSQSLKERTSLVLAILIALIVVRSPSFVSAFLVLPLYYVSALWPGVSKTRNIYANEMMVVLGSIYLVFVASVWFLMTNVEFSLGRFTDIIEGRDNSFALRIGGPFQIMMSVISREPFFGAGLGGNEAIYPIMYEIFSRTIANFEYLFGAVSSNIGPNIVAHWTYFGILGGLIMLFGMNWIVRTMIASTGVFWLIYIPFALPVGGYSFHAWMAFFFVAAVLAQARRLSIRDN